MSENLFASQKFTRLIARFAVPSIISLLVNSLYNIVDQIFIGHCVGYLGNAATGISYPLTTFCMAVALLIGDGCAARMSLKLGGNQLEDASKSVGACLSLLTASGVCLCAITLIFLPSLLYAFGSTELVFGFAFDYTQIIALGIPFVIIATGFNACIRADGGPRYAMIVMLAGAVLNIGLDALLMFVFQMGVRGAAIATVLSQVISCLLSLLYVRRFQNIKLRTCYLRPTAHITAAILRLGVSSFIIQMALTFVQIALNHTLTRYGAGTIYGSEIPLSCMSIVTKVNSIIVAFVLGTVNGCQPIIGYHYGAKNYQNVKKGYWLSVLISSCFAFCGFLVIMLFPDRLIQLFGKNDPLYIAFAVLAFRIYLMFTSFTGFQISSSHLFQAIGKPLKSSFLALSRRVLFLIPLILTLPVFFGLPGVLYAGPVSDAISIFLTTIFVSREFQILNKLIAAQRDEVPDILQQPTTN